MGDFEILHAMQQMFDSLKSDVEQQFDTVKSELHIVRSDLDNMRILMDTEMRRNIQLLAEGHEIILERLLTQLIWMQQKQGYLLSRQS